ncbi:MarR family winged helix-turn-helix transcriptional regulator [Kitasatospora sp. NPDC003701]
MNSAAETAWRTLLTLMIAGEGRDRLHDVCAKFDLTPTGLKALLLLSAGPQTMRGLADTFRWNPSFLTGVIDVLERRGAARREPHPTDRRVKTVALTAEGRELLGRVQVSLWEPPSSFDALTQDELEHLCGLLAKVAERDSELSAVLRSA